MKQEFYERLTHAGLNGVVCFQETYRRSAYKDYHPRGMKSHFDWRLNGFDRMGRAGVHKIGMGCSSAWKTGVPTSQCWPDICVICKSTIGAHVIRSISHACVRVKADTSHTWS